LQNLRQKQKSKPNRKGAHNLSTPIEQIRELRAQTGAGVLQCREALEVNGGDLDKAIAYLREKGLAAAAKKADRETSEGKVEAYGHPGGRVGVLVEVNCETDFVADTKQFQAFAHDLALHVAAMAPLYMTPEDVPAEDLETRIETYRQQALQDGKPENIVERIVEGRLNKFYTETCLMEQPFVRDDSILIKDLLQDMIVRLQENIVIRRFVRYELGQHTDQGE
jgi:elongation factor Ts